MSKPSREKEIFEAALDLESEEARAAYLDRACAGETSVRERIEALLSACESAHGFLPGDPSSEPEDSPGEGPGTVIDRYKLLEQIGEGGFGVVYMAEQLEPVKRRVALKIIKPGMDSKQVIARFEAERQALALMDHPNIAQVHDAGTTERGLPYFVMELVQGIPLTSFCREQNLDLEQRLALFIDVCNAVQHAHQKGVIHRDLKPSNILVTLHGDRPVPKVIDFGIAKATAQPLTEQTLFTQFQQFLGTPAYMSPEQAALSGLDVDTRSDVYSLGVLLYELLTGSPPFESERLLSAGLDEMRRILREEEPQKPSTKISQSRARTDEPGRTAPPTPGLKVTGELDWIVLKALEKDRDRRYETANGLAADLQRFLADEPVTAVAPSIGYQFRKFARRHKAALGFAATVAILLVAATAVSAWLALRAKDAEVLAGQRLVASEKAGEELLRSKHESDLARMEAERERDRAKDIALFMGNILKRPAPNLDGESVTVLQALDQAQEQLATDLPEQPLRRAHLQVVLGETFTALGRHQEATRQFELARDSLGEASDPDEALRLRLLTGLAASYLTLERPREAEAILEGIVRLSEGREDKTHIEAFLRARQNLAVLHARNGDTGTALGILEELLPIARIHWGDESTETLNLMSILAYAYSKADRLDAAVSTAEQMLAITRRVHGNSHPDALLGMINLATMYRSSDRLEDALALAEEAYPHCVETFGPSHPYTLDSGIVLAQTCQDLGNHDKAQERFEELLPLSRGKLGATHRRTQIIIRRLAAEYRRSGRLAEAAELESQLDPPVDATVPSSSNE